MSDEEATVVANTGAAVAHCPYSNAFFGNGVLPVRRLVEVFGLRKIGLGTDVAGGPSPSMLSAIRWAVAASHMLQDGVDRFDTQGVEVQGVGVLCPPAGPMPHAHSGAAIGLKEALWMATVGGARSLALEDTVGCFRSGMEFDALLVDPSQGTLDLFLDVDSAEGESDSSGNNNHRRLHAAVEKFLHNGDDRNILHVVVQGQRVSGAASAQDWPGPAGQQEVITLRGSSKM
jgi:guanine deaminase